MGQFASDDGFARFGFGSDPDRAVIEDASAPGFEIEFFLMLFAGGVLVDERGHDVVGRGEEFVVDGTKGALSFAEVAHKDFEIGLAPSLEGGAHPGLELKRPLVAQNINRGVLR